MQTKCGPSFRQGSFMCLDCASRFFLAGDGTCSSCPDGSFWNTFRGLIELVLGIVCAAGVVLGLLKLVVWARGGTLVHSLRLLVSLAVWTIIAMQSVSQVREPRIVSCTLSEYRALVIRVLVLS
jgi:hypothetical protein